MASRIDIACVLAKVAYETWLVAAAESLTRFLDLLVNESVPKSPEEIRHAKAWIKCWFCGTEESETQDQPALTNAIDLALCRRRLSLFDKPCRELERRQRLVPSN